MKEIFVNLKRFDVPKSLGGVCTKSNPKEWINWIIDESIKSGLGRLEDMEVTFLLPEGLVLSAVEKLEHYTLEEKSTINIGIQGGYRENIAIGGNFGAFTTNCPAAAAVNMGCSWSIIGHSEERKDKLGIISRYDAVILEDNEKSQLAKSAVDSLINQEVLCALDSQMNVLLCIGETAEEKGSGDFNQQKPRIKAVLKAQLEVGLKGCKDRLNSKKIVIGYEPIWAIGPGKTPPGEDYISFVSVCIKELVNELYGLDLPVVYGGGLKEENAGMIAGISTIGGGLVALTRFVGEIGFYPDELEKIIRKYIK